MHIIKKIKEKDINILALKNNIDQLHNENLRIPNEVIIVEPTKDLVEAVNEVSYSQKTLKNLTNLLKEETVKNGKLENQRKVI